MTIVGCDFHPGRQQIATFDVDTGEVRELKLSNGNGDAEQFYRNLPSPALIGLEASGNTQWFEELLERLGHEVSSTNSGRHAVGETPGRASLPLTAPSSLSTASRELLLPVSFWAVVHAIACSRQLSCIEPDEVVWVES